MKKTAASFRCGRTIPHPVRSFSNIKTEVELHVEFEDGDDPDKEVDVLRVMAEQLVHTHQEQVSEAIRKGEEIEFVADRIGKLEKELAKLREKQKGHQQMLFADSQVNVNEPEDY